MIEKQRLSQARKAVRLRDKKNLSWAKIADQLEVSAGTARRLYDLVMGEGAHAGLLPGKGGRLPATHKSSRRSTTRRAAAA